MRPDRPQGPAFEEAGVSARELGAEDADDFSPGDLDAPRGPIGVGALCRSHRVAGGRRGGREAQRRRRSRWRMFGA